MDVKWYDIPIESRHAIAKIINNRSYLADKWFEETYQATRIRGAWRFSNREKYVEFYLTWM